MLIANLLPLLARYSLGFDLGAGAGDTVTRTIIPRKTERAKVAPEGGEIRPISITATAAEIDAELAKGEEGALGQLIAARKSLGDQIAEQRQAAEAAKTAASAKAKPAPAKKSEPAKSTEPAKEAAPAAPSAPPAEPAPAPLW
jgi:PRTRC genetic system protein E